MRPSRRTLLIGAPVAALGAAAGGAVAAGLGGSDPHAPAGTAATTGPGTGTGPTPGTGTGTGGPVPETAPSTASAMADGPAVVTGTTFTSVARGRPVSMVVISPAGAPPGLPVCLVLHGRGDDAQRAVGLLNLDRLLTDAVRAGVAPFALVALDGGEAYWHRRASGDDPEAMIINEILPRLAGSGLRTARLAAMGWSMGGYGALLLARRHPDLVVAAAASSPALWNTYGASAPGAFDSAADFTAHQILGTAPAPGVAYRIDCGDADPFYAVSQQAARDLRVREHSFGAGGHTPAYWQAVAPAQLAFVGAALSRPA